MATTRPSDPIYLDYQATTPMDRRVLDAMLPFFTERFGNPHSEHAFGRDAAEAVDTARTQVADLIGAEGREITFTSGATESNNMVLKGVASFHGGERRRIVTSAIEHKCILEAAARLERDGFEVVRLPVGPNGHIDLGQLAAAITETTLVVSLMAVQNEIGVIAPLAEIGSLCRANGVYFHTDAAQAFGKITLDVDAMKVDLMSISAHKVYGPKGIGALYVRRKPRVRLDPLIDGGGQERGLRSGTLAPALCVGFGKAAEIAGQDMAEESARLVALRHRLERGLAAHLPDHVVNGDRDRRIGGNLNVRFPGIDGVALAQALSDVALSTGSACTSASVEPSYVLRAMGLSEAEAGSSIRIGLGRFTTEREIDIAIERIAEEVEKLRKTKPLTKSRRSAAE